MEIAKLLVSMRRTLLLAKDSNERQTHTHTMYIYMIIMPNHASLRQRLNHSHHTQKLKFGSPNRTPADLAKELGAADLVCERARAVHVFVCRVSINAYI